MNSQSTRLQQQLAQVKSCLSNIFVLLDQALSLHPRQQLQQRLRINQQIEDFMQLAGKELERFLSDLQKSRAENAALDPELEKEINSFIQQTPQAMRVLQSRLDLTLKNIEHAHGEVKQQLIKLQQSQKGFQGYKIQTRKNPKMLDSKI